MCMCYEGECNCGSRARMIKLAIDRINNRKKVMKLKIRLSFLRKEIERLKSDLKSIEEV